MNRSCDTSTSKSCQLRHLWQVGDNASWLPPAMPGLTLVEGKVDQALLPDELLDLLEVEEARTNLGFLLILHVVLGILGGLHEKTSWLHWQSPAFI